MPSSRNSPGLRKRQLTPDSSDEKAALHSPVASARAKQAAAGRYLLVLVSLSISAFIFLRTSYAPPEPPSSYALCSPDGANIYTVDPAAPRVQCVVIDGDTFVDTGSLGQVLPSHEKFLSCLPCAAGDIQTRWGGADRTDQDAAARTVVFRFLKPGAVMVPGLTGEF